MRPILSLLLLLAATPQALAAVPATLYRSPDCGCCLEYAAYLRAENYDVDVVSTDDLAAIKTTHRVPAELEGCHTTVVDGYAIEGHVPVAVLKRLLAEKPAITGISLPGMPLGSPGMGGAQTAPFVIYELDARKQVYAVEQLP